MTRSPALTVTVWGPNAKPAMETFAAAADVGPAFCWTTILRGAFPTPIVVVLPVATSKTDTLFEPSFVTYAVLPSPDSASQCGCLPTETLRTGIFVAGSN